MFGRRASFWLAVVTVSVLGNVAVTAVVERFPLPGLAELVHYSRKQ